MTSNERKIINFLRDAKEKAHIRLIAKKINFSSGYTQSLCHSLARAGYVKLEDSNVCHLLKKGQGHFESVAVMREVSEPAVITANVTLLADESTGTPLASDRDDKAGDDAELDNALANLEPSSQKDESEEKDKPEEPRDEPEDELRESEEEKTEEMAEDFKEEINTDNKEDALNKEVLAETDAAEEEEMEKQDEMELKPEPKAEEDKPVAADDMASKEKELTEEVKAKNPEKAALKEGLAKPGGGFGASFKKIVNWFAEKK